jgi:hypothetical protein
LIGVFCYEEKNLAANKEIVNDTAKLIMHRLIARKLGHDPSLIENARASLRQTAERYAGYSFIRDWNELLNQPLPEVRQLIAKRDERMARLRLSSPFALADGLHFENEEFRRRIWRAAKRIATRSASNPHRTVV